MLDTQSLYKILFSHMGSQHWWPAESKIEVILGAILVQNTNWRNAAYALEQLKVKTEFDPEQILNLDWESLQTLIKSSGFYKNKARTILNLLAWLECFDFDYHAVKLYYQHQLRNALLEVNGIGSETADVLLVYIFEEVAFIPDSYTRRIYKKLGYANTESYEKLKQHIQLPETFTNADANEFHALLDNFGKNYFNGKNEKKYTFLDTYFEE
ncbi:endonuclease III related protein [Staphylococcus cohnii]|uniref:Endonuclease III domain-containing protein n=1 Tax=Staphylococcus cohnii TaxID=29382 RepID=A0ABT6IYA7_9STAP|nr:endonuclease III [Staphylococcus cohnii]AYX89025.1 endonuclease III domain-containing protein [Staphylococcus cohnii]MCI2940420.1 endonuclease III domain-containing protein [Staphylococcus cohnii]MDE1709605.1 endonuclease III domain-containing protein [Staphylococcus cohnii]MDH5139268.1 endonuclease III domain-containing protein [Staphylococcus cohnii]MDH5157404.1 endonuclease III domain-containing protein [Staphylococcus cohnii]